MTITNQEGNKNTKWIWIGLGAAALFCLCAVAVAGFVFYRLGKQVQEGIKTDPESVAQAAHEIVDYDLPAGYKEEMAMNIMFYSIVVIGPDTYSTNQPIIMLAQFNSSIADPEQMKRQIIQSFEQQSGRRGADMQLKEIKKMTIRGEETDVAIYEGTDQSGDFVRQLIASFPGKDGTALLMIIGDAGSWDQDVLDEFIESIR